ncbi:MAG TPA: response regulator [Bacteriovoracaceae bacterium]|nr:response regulator [Bacteriovoracaceae bacterium]
MLNNAFDPEPLQRTENAPSEDISEELWPKRKKIMIIDDDMNFRLAVSEILVDNGYSVMTAKDGEMALNHLIHERDLPDLILVDLMMPIKSGLEFRREQIQLDEISDIPVVFVTGYGIIDGELCIQKPFEAKDFITQLKQYVK